jgi:hypothetical protein
MLLAAARLIVYVKTTTVHQRKSRENVEDKLL